MLTPIPPPQTQTLTGRPVPDLVRAIAIPASVGFFFNTLFNVVDTWYGGQISTQALAALSLSLPLFFLIVAVGSGLGAGTTALIGDALGRGEGEAAEIFAAQGLAFGLLAALAMAAAGLAASPSLFALLGATGEYRAIALAYMNVIFAGSPFFIANYMLAAALNALGETKPFRNVLIFGCLLNVLLDPWFIHGGLGLPALGFPGIAAATILIQALGGLYLLVRVRRTSLRGALSPRRLRPRGEPFRQIARQGLPAAANFLTIGLGIFVITYFVSGFGKEAVAAYGAAMRIEQIALLPALGLTTATLAMVSQNSGAGLHGRVSETVRTALRYGGLTMLFGTAAVFLLAGPLMALFTADEAVIAIGRTYLRISAFVLYAYVVLAVHVAALQGIREPFFGLWIGLWRQIVAPAVLFWVLTRLFGLGLAGIWWGIFGITWSAAAFAWLYARRRLRLTATGRGGAS